VDNSGHYTCTALNAVGSTLARSHVVVFDTTDFDGGTPTTDHQRVYEAQGGERSSKLEEARCQFDECPFRAAKIYRQIIIVELLPKCHPKETGNKFR
jgi:hypothetical protein